MRLERHDLAVVLVYAIGVGVLTLATPIAVQALVNTVAFGTLLQPLAVLAFLLLVGLAFAAVLRALQAWVVEVLQRRIFLRFVADLSHRLPRVRLSAFDAAHGPELLNRFFDVFTVQKASSSLLLGGLDAEQQIHLAAKAPFGGVRVVIQINITQKLAVQIRRSSQFRVDVFQFPGRGNHHRICASPPP